MIIGNVRDEFRHWDHAPTLAQVQGFVPARYAAEAPRIVAAVQAAYPAARPVDIGGMITGISWRNAALDQARKKHAQNAGAVYSYWLTYVAPQFDGGTHTPRLHEVPTGHVAPPPHVDQGRQSPSMHRPPMHAVSSMQLCAARQAPLS